MIATLDYKPIGEMVPESHGPERFSIQYSVLVEKYGEPNSTDDDYKVDASWDLGSPFGRVHVYNYCNGPTYTGEGAIEDIDAWSVQGESEQAVKRFIAEAQT